MTNSENTAIAFSITRLNCSKHTIKLSGHWQPDHANTSEIDVQQLHIMGTDGWEKLNLNANNTECLVQELLPEIQHYLLNQHKL